MTEHAKDFAIGGTGIMATISLAQFNQMLACGVGILSIAVMTMRLAREWRRKQICDECQKVKASEE